VANGRPLGAGSRALNNMSMEYDFRVGENVHTIAAEKKGERWLVAVDGRAMDLDVVAAEPNTYSLLTDAARASRVVVVRDGPTRYVALDGHVVTLEEPAAEGYRPADEEDVVAGVQTIRAPMPGKVVKVAVAAGAAVTKGQTVVVVEAMKMEHPLAAAGAGTVQKIMCAEGQNVDASQPLAEVAVGAA